MTNGELLTAAEQAGFELFLTADQEIAYQQNLADRKLAVLVLSTNNWSVLKAGAAAVRAAIAGMKPGSYAEVEIAEPGRIKTQ